MNAPSRPLTSGAKPASTLRIHLFGRPYLTEDEAPLKSKARANALSLLGYLLVHRATPLTRDAVAFALWPDDTEANARANLRRHLFYLTNDVLPSTPPQTPWLVTEKRTIGWNAAAPAWCDLHEFERLAGDANATAEAVTLYRGDLLEGFEDEWLEAPRERFRDQQMNLLLSLITAARETGAYADGISYARQLLALDPWREDAIRALIALRNAVGDRAGALATYRDFVKRLDAEIGAVPMLETTSMYERVANAELLGTVFPSTASDRAASIAPSLPLNRLTPTNLPLQMTSFVGRGREITEIHALIKEHRLVTLVGSGGIGKTRVSLQVAFELLEGAPDGVWFIELAPLASGDYLPSTIAQAMAITLAVDGDPLDNLVRALTSKRVVLVFDNCEHLIEATARVLAALLRSCPQMRVLASSRQGLNLSAEATYRMPSLALPNNHDSTRITAADSTEYAAISLFVERASAADKRLKLTDENAPTIADICRRLDGIPLAIELAASRVKMLSLPQLRERLDERFRVLTSGNRDVLPRQQTLRALIDWSYDLLDERERALFRRLGIFVNGFALDGAAAIGSSDDLTEPDVFDVLASLVDKSLVLAEADGDALRYRLLESTRAYACEKLADAGELKLLTRRHLYYLRDHFTKLWTHEERTARRADKEAAFASELEDVRAALDSAIAAETIAGAQLLAQIGPNWNTLGLDAEGIARNETYLAVLPADNSLIAARLLEALSVLLRDSGRKARGFDVAVQAVASARSSGDGPLLAYVLRNFAVAAIQIKKLDEAEAALASAQAIPASSAHLALSLLGARALLGLSQGNLDAAAVAYEQLRSEHRALGNTRSELTASANLAENEHARGLTQRAITIAREMLPVLREGSDRSFLANVLGNIAGYLVAIEDLSGAIAAAREATVLLASGEPDQPFVTNSIEHIALVYALRGDFVNAAMLEGYVDTALRHEEFERDFTEKTTHDRVTGLLREKLVADDLGRLIIEGAALTPKAAVAIALQDRRRCAKVWRPANLACDLLPFSKCLCSAAD